MSGCSLGLRLAVEHAVELLLELVEEREPVAGRLVAELVDEPREAVDREQVVARLAPEHAGGDGEVLLRRERKDGALAGEEPFRCPLIAGRRGHSRSWFPERCVNASPADPVRRIIRAILAHRDGGSKRSLPGAAAWSRVWPKTRRC